MKKEIFEKAQQLVTLLKDKNLKIATAESCTGGMVSCYITSVSGASQVLELGITSYSNRIKNKILNVNTQTLDTLGAVSSETAEQMAKNVREISDADIGVSVTGVAGPDSQDGYQPGNVFIALSDSGGTFSEHLKIDPKNREFVREQAVKQLFDTVINHIKQFKL